MAIADNAPALNRVEILYYFQPVFGECHRFVMGRRWKEASWRWHVTLKKSVDVISHFMPGSLDTDRDFMSCCKLFIRWCWFIACWCCCMSDCCWSKVDCGIFCWLWLCCWLMVGLCCCCWWRFFMLLLWLLDNLLWARGLSISELCTTSWMS